MTRQLTDQVHALLVAEGLTPDTLPPTAVGLSTDDGVMSADDEAVHTLRMPVQGKKGEWMCLVRVFEQTERLLVYSMLPREVPLAQRERIALMLTHINYGLVMGNFEMDLDDGEVRYKTSIDIEGIDLTGVVLRNILFGNFFSMDLYYKALMDALDGDRDPAALVYEAEHPDLNAHGLFDLVDDVVH
ncbi:MAG: hypothetical protein RLY58_2458 [Pseudomonadota bacterium]|jgi:hypothetical protein